MMMMKAVEIHRQVLVTLVKAFLQKAAVAVRVLAEFECKHCLRT